MSDVLRQMNQLEPTPSAKLTKIKMEFRRLVDGSKLARMSWSLSSYILAPMNKGISNRGAVDNVLSTNVPKDKESKEASSRFV